MDALYVIPVQQISVRNPQYHTTIPISYTLINAQTRKCLQICRSPRITPTYQGNPYAAGINVEKPMWETEAEAEKRLTFDGEMSMWPSIKRMNAILNFNMLALKLAWLGN
jgi:hypothetical protein